MPEYKGKVLRERVFIVAGGPSLYGFDFHRLANQDTIVVNDSVFCVPNPNYFVTMDFTWTLKKNIHYGKRVDQRDEAFFAKDLQRYFVVGFRGDRLGRTEHGIIDKKRGVTYDLRLFDIVVYSSGYGGLGGSFDDFRCGSDSGYSTIQLAVALGYKQIYLLGMDFSVVEDNTNMRSSKITRSRSRIAGKVNRSIAGKVNRSIVGGAVHCRALETRTHFHSKKSRALGNELKIKLEEFLTPYPQMFSDAAGIAGLVITSCSNISRLNKWIPYVNVDTLV